MASILFPIYFGIPCLEYTLKTNLYETSDCWSRDILNFNFLKRGTGLVILPHSVRDISRKKFLMLYYINWTNFIVWLLLLPEITVNMCIVNVCYPVCDDKFWKVPYLSYQTVVLHDQKVKIKI